MTHEISAEYRGIPVPNNFLTPVLSDLSFTAWARGVDSAKDHSTEPEVKPESKYRYAKDRYGWYLRYKDESSLPLFWDSWDSVVDEVSSVRGATFDGLLEVWSDEVTEVPKSEVPEYVLAAFQDYEG